MDKQLAKRAWQRALNPPPLPPRPLLTREAASDILLGMVEAYTERIEPEDKWDPEDNQPMKHMKAMRGFLIGAARRVLRGDDPLVVLSYDVIHAISDRDVVALVRAALTTGFPRPRGNSWGWQVVGDEIRWVSKSDWDYYFTMQTGVDP